MVCKDPRFYLLSVLFLSWENWEKVYLGWKETFYVAKPERFHPCPSIRMISISKAGCDFEMKIQTTHPQRLQWDVLIDLSFLFYSLLGPFCLQSIYSCKQALHLTSSNFSPLRSSAGRFILVEVPLPLDAVYPVLIALFLEDQAIRTRASH